MGSFSERGQSHGTLTLNADGSFTYTPADNYFGPDTFTYAINDGTTNALLPTLVTIAVANINDLPVGVVDGYLATEGEALTIDASHGVLANDIDLDGDTLTATIVTGPIHGTLTLNADGSFTYTPAVNYFGTDTFTYQINDGTANALLPTLVTIAVANINDLPVGVVDAYLATEGNSLNVDASDGVLANDIDLDGDTLTATIVTGPTHGTLMLNTDGSFTYTPADNYFGTDTFTYQINDGTADALLPTLVTIAVTNINDAPLGVVDTYTATEGGALTINATQGVLANDIDFDNDALSATVVTGPANGTLILNADGSFSYTPDAHYFGIDGFTYRVNDGTANAVLPTQVTIVVTNINDLPVATADVFITNRNVPLSGSVTANDIDLDGDSLHASVLAGPSNGSLTLNDDGTFIYTPNTNFAGLDTFTYQVSDGTANALLPGLVTITVNLINVAPTAYNDSFNTTEDVAIVIPTGSGVLGNDNDIDGNPLTAQLVSGPGHGTLSLNTDGSFTYTPTANYNGTDTFTYRANDGAANSNTATVTLTITAVNDAPVAVNDSYTATEDSPLVVTSGSGVLFNDSDVEGNPLTAAVVAGPSHGTLSLNTNGSFTYTPTANYNGTDTFTYRANDGAANSNTATVTLTITAVNDAPVAVNDVFSTDKNTSLTSTVVANDSDVEGSTLTAALGVGPSHGNVVLNANGTFTYTPNTDYTGADSFTYRINDGQVDSNVATVVINVNSVNSAPVAVTNSYTTAEDTVLTVPMSTGVLANDTDADTNPLTAQVVSGPAHGTLALNTDGSFTYTPTANYAGSDSFTYRANDGQTDSNTATVNLTVTAVNDAPVGTSDAYSANVATGTLGLFRTVAGTPNVLANDSDVDSSSLTVELVSGPSHASSFTLNANGTFSYTSVSVSGLLTPNDSFVYRVWDGNAYSANTTVAITISLL